MATREAQPCGVVKRSVLSIPSTNEICSLGSIATEGYGKILKVELSRNNLDENNPKSKCRWLIAWEQNQPSVGSALDLGYILSIFAPDFWRLGWLGIWSPLRLDNLQKQSQNGHIKGHVGFMSTASCH